MEVGMRVVRGPDWKWAAQDEGEGHAGTVVEVGRQGSACTPDRTAVVQWDGGVRTNYRAGYQGAYDLRLYDNAQIGVRHPNIICDSCKKHGIVGMRWRCSVCYDFDLCTQCYMGNKHDLGHAFERHETALSRPVPVSSRAGLERVQLRGLFQGAKVVRGPDWDWGNQDGGDGKHGKVNEIRGWDAESWRSVACVTWANGSTNVYRVGHKGKVDLKCIADSHGGYYFAEHLPLLGEPAEVRGQEMQEERAFQVGDKVKCLLEEDILRQMQDGHGGWNPKMAEFIGKVGTVHRITERGDVRVEYGGTKMRWTYHSGALTKVDTFSVGDLVRVLDDEDRVKQLQVGHGEWNEAMRTAVGQVGQVVKVYTDGDLRVCVRDKVWTFNALCASAVRLGDVDANNLMSTEHREGAAMVCQKDGMAVHGVATEDSSGVSELVSEASLGNLGRVVEILQRFPDKVDGRSQGKTALQVASFAGHGALLDALLRAGARTDVRDDEGDAALHYAAFGNRAAAATALLGAGANVDAANKASTTALHVAASIGHTDVVMALLAHRADVNAQDVDGDTPLHEAISRDHRDVVEQLSAVPIADFSLRNRRGFNLLHQAALKGSAIATHKILGRARQLVDVKKDDGFAPIHLAALNNHQEVARILVAEGQCDVDVRTNRAQTPLLLAVLQGHVELVQLLVAERCDVNARDEDGDTALHLALGRTHVAVVPAGVVGVAGGSGSGGAAGAAGAGQCAQSSTRAANDSLVNRLKSTGLLGPTDPTTGAAIACFLAQEGADIALPNVRGKAPLDLVHDPRLAQLLKDFADWAQQARREATLAGGGAGPSVGPSAGPSAGPPLQCLAGTHAPSPRRAPPPNPINTVTNLAMVAPSPQQPPATVVVAAAMAAMAVVEHAECLVCNEVAPLVRFLPCEHSVACEECTVKMKKCISCQVTIVKKLRSDGTELDIASLQTTPTPSSSLSPSSSGLPLMVGGGDGTSTPTPSAALPVVGDPGAGSGAGAEEVAELVRRCRDMESRLTCPVCMDQIRDIVFLCGHGACGACAPGLAQCPLCRQVIQKRIHMYV
ncbi:E3 ubiquitin-protein ligase MIB2 isoform X2 [Lampetra fluviatilis]